MFLWAISSLEIKVGAKVHILPFPIRSLAAPAMYFLQEMYNLRDLVLNNDLMV